MAFAPDDLSGLVLWLKADAGVTKNASNQVSAWADQSSAGNDYSQSTDADKPIYNATYANGDPCLVFSGSGNKHMTADSLIASDITKMTFFVVSEQFVAGSTSAMLWSHQDEATQLVQIGYHNTQKAFLQVRDADSTIASCFGPATTLAEFQIVDGSFDRTQDEFECSICGDTVEDDDNVDGTVESTKEILGATDQGSGIAYPLKDVGGSIAEVVMYNRVLNTGQRRRVHRYLRNKYGITCPA